MRVFTILTALVLLALAPEPRLVNQTGHAFALASLRGTSVAVTFISAHCTDACPLIDAQFATAARQIEYQHIAARLLTITLDPEHDSLAAMRTLALRFGANPRYWLLAGGSVRDVHAIMRAFGVVSVQGARGYHDEHSTFVYIFDSGGNLVRTMLASTNLSDALVSQVKETIRHE